MTWLVPGIGSCCKGLSGKCGDTDVTHLGVAWDLLSFIDNVSHRQPISSIFFSSKGAKTLQAYEWSCVAKVGRDAILQIFLIVLDLRERSIRAVSMF